MAIIDEFKITKGNLMVFCTEYQGGELQWEICEKVSKLGRTYWYCKDVKETKGHISDDLIKRAKERLALLSKQA